MEGGKRAREPPVCARAKSMQQLSYVNTLGERIDFGALRPLVFCSVRGLGTPDLDVKTIVGAYQQGDVTASLTRKARHVDLTLHLLADDRRALYETRRSLCGALSPDKAVDGEHRARLLYKNDGGSYWTWAVPEGGLDWGARLREGHASVRLSFRCESPYWYGMAPNTARFCYKGSGFQLPFQFPIKFGNRAFRQAVTNAGHGDAPVEVTIWGKGETPVLVNQSTGRRIALVSPLPDGDVLRICTDPARLSVTVTHPDGTTENAFGYLDASTSLSAFALRPGENALVYRPGGEQTQSTVHVNWYDCYEGV